MLNPRVLALALALPANAVYVAWRIEVTSAVERVLDRIFADNFDGTAVPD
ncbi:MAG: hypothetical protein ABIR62_17390 [Dokdonella sp.]